MHRIRSGIVRSDMKKSHFLSDLCGMEVRMLTYVRSILVLGQVSAHLQALQRRCAFICFTREGCTRCAWSERLGW